jgi:hypothetical protein
MAWILHDVFLAVPPADYERRLKRRLANPATGCVACGERIFQTESNGVVFIANVASVAEAHEILEALPLISVRISKFRWHSVFAR